MGAKRALTFCRNLPRVVGPLGRRFTSISSGTMICAAIPDAPGHFGQGRGYLAHQKEINAEPGDLRNRWKTLTQGFWKGLKRELTSLPFDRYAKFLPWTLRGCKRFIETQECVLIQVNAGPFSGLILGTILSKQTGLPLVLDLRDPWAHDPIYSEAWGTIGAAMARKIERWAFEQASRVVMNSESAVTLYRDAYEGILPAEHFEFIRNHFDETLYDPLPSPPSIDDPFRVVFFGHLTPIRNGELFFEAWRRFIDREELKVGDAVLLTLGEHTQADDEAVRSLDLTNFVDRAPWRPFIRSRELLGTADVLLDLTSPRHGLRIAGKLYDYLCAQRPILSVSNNPEVARIHADTKVGICVDHDVNAIVDALSELYRRKREGIPFEPDQSIIHGFSAGPAAKKMARIFDQAVSARESAQ